MVRGRSGPYVPCKDDERPFARRTAQGKPVVRRGRKARDLGPHLAPRPPGCRFQGDVALPRECVVKANLGRFTTALALLATLALSLGAGARWC